MNSNAAVNWVKNHKLATLFIAIIIVVVILLILYFSGVFGGSGDDIEFAIVNSANPDRAFSATQQPIDTVWHPVLYDESHRAAKPSDGLAVFTVNNCNDGINGSNGSNSPGKLVILAKWYKPATPKTATSPEQPAAVFWQEFMNSSGGYQNSKDDRTRVNALYRGQQFKVLSINGRDGTVRKSRHYAVPDNIVDNTTNHIRIMSGTGCNALATE